MHSHRTCNETLYFCLEKLCNGKDRTFRAFPGRILTRRCGGSLVDWATTGVMAACAPHFCFPQVLHCCACGSSTYTQQSHYTLTLADLSSADYDPFLPLASVKSSEPVQYHSAAELGNLLTVEEGEYSTRWSSVGGRRKACAPLPVLAVLSFEDLAIPVEILASRVFCGGKTLPSLFFPFPTLLSSFFSPS